MNLIAKPLTSSLQNAMSFDCCEALQGVLALLKFNWSGDASAVVCLPHILAPE